MPEGLVKTILFDTSDPVTGNSPVVFTVIYNEIRIMEETLRLGGSLTKQNKENYSPFHFGNIRSLLTTYLISECTACMYSNYATVSHLVSQHSPELGVGGLHGQSCLHLASSRQDTEASKIVKLILDHGDQSSVLEADSFLNIPLFCAIEAGNIEVVKELLAVADHAQVCTLVTMRLND